MEDVWIEALHQYIEGDKWLLPAMKWIDANCAAFDGVEPGAAATREFDAGQFALFCEFRELADGLLGALLDEVRPRARRRPAPLVIESATARSSSAPHDHRHRDAHAQAWLRVALGRGGAARRARAARVGDGERVGLRRVVGVVVVVRARRARVLARPRRL